jgi:hypothetical protein
MLVAVVFLVGFAAGSLWGFGARSIPLSGEELLERAITITALPLLAGLVFCCIKLKSCRLSIVVTLTALWLGIYTWLYWFSFSAPAQMTELHSLDANEIRAETLRHFAFVAVMYLIVVAAFSILPVLKFLEARRGRSYGRVS